MFRVLLMFGIVSELHGVDMLEIVRVGTPCKQTGHLWLCVAHACPLFLTETGFSF